MAKRELQQKRHISNRDNVTTIEQTEQFVVDDSLLPTAEELAKLKELDPNIIAWVKERCVAEQDTRIYFNRNQIKIARKDVSWFHLNNLFSMIFVFLVAIAGLGMSCFLVYNDYVVFGSIFGTTGLAIMLWSMRKSGNR